MYKILIDELVLKEDFKKIYKHGQRKIIKAIREKLTTEPEKYGKPLHAPLKEFWKLRVGKYRVIYEIKKSEVFR